MIIADRCSELKKKKEFKSSKIKCKPINGKRLMEFKPIAHEKTGSKMFLKDVL